MARQRARTTHGSAYELKMAILNTPPGPDGVADLAAVQRQVGKVFDFAGAHISQINIAHTILIEDQDVRMSEPPEQKKTSAPAHKSACTS